MTRSPVLCATAAFLCGTLCANDCAYGSPDAVVVFNEVHYNPLGTDESGEWIELFNQMGIKTDISGWRLAGGIDYTFPQGTILFAEASHSQYFLKMLVSPCRVPSLSPC